MSLFGNVSHPIVSQPERVATTMSRSSFVRLAAALLVTASGFQLLPEPLNAEESSDHETMAAQIEYMGNVGADAIEHPVLDAGRFRVVPLAGPDGIWSMALGCGNTSGGDQVADAAPWACPPGLEDMIIEEAERMCSGRLTVYSVVCRYLGNGWWDFELRGRCD